MSCCKKWQKSLNQETGLGNRGHLKVLNNTKLVLNDHLGLIWYYSEQVSWLGFFLRFLQQDGSSNFLFVLLHSQYAYLDLLPSLDYTLYISFVK